MSKSSAPAIVAAAVTLFAQAALAQRLPDHPRAFVEDLAGVIAVATEQRLNTLLHELQQKTGAELVVLTVESTGDQDIGDFSLQTAERWKLGQQGKDNGVLVAIAIRNRKYSIEVGYGLEHILPDQFCGSIGREHFQPYFRRGDYSGGIEQGVRALVSKVAASENVRLDTPRPRAVPAVPLPRMGGVGRALLGCCCTTWPFVLVLIVAAMGAMRGRGYRYWGYSGPPWWWWLLLAGSMSSGRRRGGWSGGFGGGSFGGGFGGGGGGFSIGGGGSFGGGGARGGW